MVGSAGVEPAPAYETGALPLSYDPMAPALGVEPTGRSFGGSAAAVARRQLENGPLPLKAPARPPLWMIRHGCLLFYLAPRERFELPPPGASPLRSTTELPWRNLILDLCRDSDSDPQENGTGSKPVASANWATFPWCPRLDSNQHQAGFESAASANWATWTWRQRRDSNSEAFRRVVYSPLVSPVTTR